MNRGEIMRIVLDEFKKSKNPKAELVELIVRIETQIAMGNIRPHISEDRWNMFLCTVRADTELADEVDCSEHEGREEFAVANAVGVLETYALIERGLLFLLDHYEETPSDFREEWSRDQLVNEAGAIEAEREMKAQELADTGKIIFSVEREEYLVDHIGIVSFGMLGGELFVQHHLELMVALTILRALL